MSLRCPECHGSPDLDWIDWEDHTILRLVYTSRMSLLLGTLDGVSKRQLQRLNEEQSTASLCQCPLCKKLVVYLVSDVPISDRTGDTLYHVVKLSDVAEHQLKPT